MAFESFDKEPRISGESPRAFILYRKSLIFLDLISSDLISYGFDEWRLFRCKTKLQLVLQETGPCQSSISGPSPGRYLDMLHSGALPVLLYKKYNFILLCSKTCSTIMFHEMKLHILHAR